MSAVQVTDERAIESTTPVVVVVIPAYNEEWFIASVVITAQMHADHVIVVDDGSTDRTALLAKMAGADVVVMPENGGKGKALNAGLDRAREYGADVVVMLDGDAQHDPAEIPGIVAPVLTGEADLVVGSRFLGPSSSIPRWRRMGQRALNFLTHHASGVDVTDSQSGFRGLGPRALDRLRFSSPGLAVESEMQFFIERSALRVAEVPISVQYLDGNKRNPVLHGLQVVDAVLGLVARRRPLVFFCIPGVSSMVLGFLLGVLVVHTVDTAHIVPVGTSVLSALLLMFGLLLSVTGVILNTLEHLVARLRVDIRQSVVR